MIGPDTYGLNGKLACPRALKKLNFLPVARGKMVCPWAVMWLWAVDCDIRAKWEVGLPTGVDDA